MRAPNSVPNSNHDTAQWRPQNHSLRINDNFTIVAGLDDDGSTGLNRAGSIIELLVRPNFMLIEFRPILCLQISISRLRFMADFAKSEFSYLLT